MVASRVARAWERQLVRQGCLNGELPQSGLEERLGLRRVVRTLLARRAEQFRLSPRRLHRALRVARTVADLQGDEDVTGDDLDEALRYRPEASR